MMNSDELRKGTTFHVYLSFQPSLKRTSIEKPTRRMEGFADKGGLVLVVDDEDAILRMTPDVLDASGYRVLTATNGADAVDLYGCHPEHIDLVVMDLLMPGMDGSVAIRT